MASEPAREHSINMVVVAPLQATNPVQALDAAVYEVFECMLGLGCVAQHASPQEISSIAAVDSGRSIHWKHPVSAILGFAGKLSGSCTMSAEPAAVALIAKHLLSPTLPRAYPSEPDVQVHNATVADSLVFDPLQLNDTMLDSFGEICNMIAGGWKNRIPGLDSGCALSVPTIISGSDYVLHPVGDRLLVERIYHFKGHKMLLVIRCEEAGSHLF